MTQTMKSRNLAAIIFTALIACFYLKLIAVLFVTNLHNNYLLTQNGNTATCYQLKDEFTSRSVFKGYN